MSGLGCHEPQTLLCEIRISERVFVWTLGGDSMATSWGANCTAILGDRGVVLVDPLIAPAHAKLVERALRGKTTVPVTHVLLTHHHTDHALGSSYFNGRGAEVIAHRLCAERMEAEHPALVASRRADPETAALFADARPRPPTRTFEKDCELDLGGVSVRIIPAGHGHTPGDAMAWVPEESVAICGDLVSHGYHSNMEDASPAGIEAALDTVASLAARICIPGHGAAGGPERIDEQRAYHREVAGAVDSGLRAGLAADAILQEISRRFPGHRLAVVLPAAVACWQKDRNRGDGFATIAP